MKKKTKNLILNSVALLLLIGATAGITSAIVGSESNIEITNSTEPLVHDNIFDPLSENEVYDDMFDLSGIYTKNDNQSYLLDSGYLIEKEASEQFVFSGTVKGETERCSKFTIGTINVTEPYNYLQIDFRESEISIYHDNDDKSREFSYDFGIVTPTDGKYSYDFTLIKKDKSFYLSINDSKYFYFMDSFEYGERSAYIDAGTDDAGLEISNLEYVTDLNYVNHKLSKINIDREINKSALHKEIDDVESINVEEDDGSNISIVNDVHQFDTYFDDEF